MSGECQTGTYNCSGDCVLSNKTNGTRCGTSSCPAKHCQNGVCEFGAVNSCPAGQVCTGPHGCILSGRRSQERLPNGMPYVASCSPCGSSGATCCQGRSCGGGRQCVRTSGEYCLDCTNPADCVDDNNDYCENNYYR
jgi:hypothetical protein